MIQINTDRLNVLMIRTLSMCGMVTFIAACSSTPVERCGTTSGDTINDFSCLELSIKHQVDFYAAASAESMLQVLEEATSKLASRISSKSGAVKQSIPVAKFKLVDHCKKDATFYAALALSKTDLVSETRENLKAALQKGEALLQASNKASPFQRYKLSAELKLHVTMIRGYMALLQHYDKQPIPKRTFTTLTLLEKSAQFNSRLLVNFRSEAEFARVIEGIKSVLERADLNYKSSTSNSAITMQLKTSVKKKKFRSSFIVTTDAVLEVTRADNGERLAEFKTETLSIMSVVSYQDAIERTNDKLLQRVIAELTHGNEVITKRLGIE